MYTGVDSSLSGLLCIRLRKGVVQHHSVELRLQIQKVLLFFYRSSRVAGPSVDSIRYDAMQTSNVLNAYAPFNLIVVVWLVFPVVLRIVMKTCWSHVVLMVLRMMSSKSSMMLMS